MTAPEPPSVPDVWWSPAVGLIQGSEVGHWRVDDAGRWVLVMDAAVPADAVRLVPEPAPAPSPRLIYDDLGHFHGVVGGTCEHRTVGSHRAWCHDCGEWCYPSDPCPRCQLVLAPVRAERDQLRAQRDAVLAIADGLDQQAPSRPSAPVLAARIRTALGVDDA